MSPRATNAVLFLVMCGIWGLTWLPVKVATLSVPPVYLAGVRFTLAGGVYVVWAFLGRHPLGTTRPLRLAVAVLLLTPGCHALLFWGVQHAPTGLAAVVNFALMPIFSVAVGVALGEERLDRRRLAAMALGIAGLGFLFWPRIGGAAPGGGDVALGLGAVVVATLSYAAGGVVARPLLRTMHPVAFSAWTLPGGLILLAISAAAEGPLAVSTGAIVVWPPVAALAFLIVFGSLAAFTIYLRLLRDWGPFGAALYAFVSPAVAISVGVVALGETVGGLEAAGMVLMFAATAVALWPARR